MKINMGNVATHSHRTCTTNSNCSVQYTLITLNPSAAESVLDMAVALRDESVATITFGAYDPDAEFVHERNEGMLMAWDTTATTGTALKSKGKSGGVKPIASCNPRPGYRTVMISLVRCDQNADDMDHAFDLLAAGFQVNLYTDGESFRVYPKTW